MVESKLHRVVFELIVTWIVPTKLEAHRNNHRKP